MKKLFIIFSLTFVCACQNANAISAIRPYKNQNLSHKAYYYYGLSETKDRQLIKELTGVDPTRTEWCAAFVNMVLLENGYPTSASVSGFPLMARSFLEYGEKTTKPVQGDIVIFERGNSGWKGHVGFFISAKDINGVQMISVLGGNQDDAVNIKYYPASKVLGFRKVPKPES